ncbi:tetratricopeptide repeat protein [Luteolibacter algae]|uniref:Tetratricopeptide repeat protein n=1 Tax=Luteolibacter algae TaxID=454151 RepID=A0ABW5D8H5_9BACT
MVQDLLMVGSMVTKQILRAASGWLELGMPDDALEELKSLGSTGSGQERRALELKLAAEMAKEDWTESSKTAGILCRMAVDDPEFFLSAAYCNHEAGNTEEAKNWLMRGPDVLNEMPVYHYNMACYLWKLGESERAKNHLAKAVQMDESFLDSAKQDRDLVGMEL